MKPIRARYTGILLALGLMLVVGPIGTAITKAQGESLSNWTTDLTAASARARKERKVMLVCFRSPSCGPCTAYRLSLFPSKEFQAASKNLILVDIDVLNFQRIADKYKVTTTPDLRFYSPSGAQIDRIVGFDRKALFAKMKSVQLPKTKQKAKPAH